MLCSRAPRARVGARCSASARAPPRPLPIPRETLRRHGAGSLVRMRAAHAGRGPGSVSQQARAAQRQHHLRAAHPSKPLHTRQAPANKDRPPLPGIRKDANLDAARCTLRLEVPVDASLAVALLRAPQAAGADVKAALRTLAAQDAAPAQAPAAAPAGGAKLDMAVSPVAGQSALPPGVTYVFRGSALCPLCPMGEEGDGSGYFIAVPEMVQVSGDMPGVNTRFLRLKPTASIDERLGELRALRAIEGDVRYGSPDEFELYAGARRSGAEPHLIMPNGLVLLVCYTSGEGAWVRYRGLRRALGLVGVEDPQYYYSLKDLKGCGTCALVHLT